MLKFIITSLLLILTSINLFPQRLCEESIYTSGLFKTDNPNVIIIRNPQQIYYYDVVDCKVIDTFKPSINANQFAFRFGLNSEIGIIGYLNDENETLFHKFNRETKELLEPLNLENYNKFPSFYRISNDGSKVYLLYSAEKKMNVYDMNDGSIINVIDLQHQHLHDMKFSPNGNLICVFSKYSDYGTFLDIYNAHTLEFIRSINFRDYFEEDDFNTSSGFDFNPINNEILISSEREILNINPYTGDSRVIIDDSYIAMKEVDVTNEGDLVIAGIGNKWNVGIFNPDIKNDYYLLNEVTQYIAVNGENLIGANQNPSKNIFKLSLITNIEESEEIQLSVFPNPNSGSLNVSFQNSQPSQIQIKLFNIQGELIQVFYDELYIEPLFTMALDISNNPNGSYLLEIRIGENEYVENIILEK